MKRSECRACATRTRTMSLSGDDAAAAAAPSPPPPPTAAEIIDDSSALNRRMPLRGGASLESLRLECACSSAAAAVAEVAAPLLLLLRRLDAEERVEGRGRMPEMGAAQRGQVVSLRGERAAMRVRKQLKCMR